MLATPRTPRLRSFCTCSIRSTEAKLSTDAPPRKPTRHPAKVHQKPAKASPALKPVELGQGIPRTELFVKLAEAGSNAIARRPTLVNENAARDLVREWGIDKMHDPVVVDAFAGAFLPF